MDGGRVTITHPDITTRHGFLAALHDVVRAETYLEVGVQHGYSLQLAHGAQVAYGIDPNPLIHASGNQILFQMTSDEFFAPDYYARPDPLRVDLAFIDGMHLVEYALRDFANIERYCHPRSVVAFDDVLPRNAHEARRVEPGTPIVGDWTGDVWRVRAILNACRPTLTLRLVDVQPTGLLLVTGFGKIELDDLGGYGWSELPVPQVVYNRLGALKPLVALQHIRRELYPGEDAP